MKYSRLFSVMAFTTLIASCELAPFEESDTAVVPDETVVEEESSLYTEDTDSDGETFVFETNDTKYLNEAGYTIWTTKYVNEADNFSPISVTLCKESGISEAGFGIVFCSQEIDDRPFMLTVLINSNGLYTVGKVDNGVFSHLNGGWKGSSYINRGQGIRNEVSVSYDGVGKKFLLKINGYEITDFTVPEKIKFKDSRWGFAVVIAGNEAFPNLPVKVIFEK